MKMEVKVLHRKEEQIATKSPHGLGSYSKGPVGKWEYCSTPDQLKL